MAVVPVNVDIDGPSAHGNQGIQRGVCGSRALLSMPAREPTASAVPCTPSFAFSLSLSCVAEKDSRSTAVPQ